MLQIPELARKFPGIWKQRSLSPRFPTLATAVYARWLIGEPLDEAALIAAQRHVDRRGSWYHYYKNGVYAAPDLLWVIQKIGPAAAGLRTTVEGIRDRTQDLSEWRAAQRALAAIDGETSP